MPTSGGGGQPPPQGAPADATVDPSAIVTPLTDTITPASTAATLVTNGSGLYERHSDDFLESIRRGLGIVIVELEAQLHQVEIIAVGQFPTDGEYGPVEAGAMVDDALSDGQDLISPDMVQYPCPTTERALYYERRRTAGELLYARTYWNSTHKPVRLPRDLVMYEEKNVIEMLVKEMHNQLRIRADDTTGWDMYKNSPDEWRRYMRREQDYQEYLKRMKHRKRRWEQEFVGPGARSCPQ